MANFTFFARDLSDLRIKNTVEKDLATSYINLKTILGQHEFTSSTRADVV
jgi:hypothetical protein